MRIKPSLNTTWRSNSVTIDPYLSSYALVDTQEKYDIVEPDIIKNSDFRYIVRMLMEDFKVDSPHDLRNVINDYISMRDDVIYNQRLKIAKLTIELRELRCEMNEKLVIIRSSHIDAEDGF